MIKLNQLFMPLDYTDKQLKQQVQSLLRIDMSEIEKIVITKKSVDSRKKSDIKYSLNVLVQVKNQNKFVKQHPKFIIDECNYDVINLDSLVKGINIHNPKYKPIIIGSGPCGIFAALTLAKAGLKPIVVERGGMMQDRKKAVDNFFSNGSLDTECNIQFGEGGAGTFSDGKLNTGTKDSNIVIVLREFVKYGANPSILINAKPHIGTDVLERVVVNIRKDIIAMGGEFLFNTKLVDITSDCGNLKTLTLYDKEKGKYDIQCNHCILAIGHSSRDTLEMLERKVTMLQKPFAIGVRIEHLQKDISYAQYGKCAELLPAADYKLACHLDDLRSCFTFCMCPGGVVVPASSEQACVVTNGMSNYAREQVNANSALLVNVMPQDFGSQATLAGVEFQRKYERAAYKISNCYKAPMQLVGDFLSNKQSTQFGEIKPSYALGGQLCDLRECLPKFVSDNLKKAIKIFGNKIQGFDRYDSVLTGVETRTSSPVRIVRNNDGCSNIGGLMPSGEGAGYAGGIMSACTDGISQALKLINNI